MRASTATDPRPAPARGLWPLVLALAVLVLLVRFVPVLALADVFFYGEELEKATAGKAMLDGLDVEHHRLAYHYYEGGGFLVSHLDALAFALFGQSLLALKLVSLGFNVAVLAAGVLLCDRFFGRGSAFVFGLLFAFAPAAVQKNSLLALGIHFQSLPFVLGVLYLAGRVVFDGERRPAAFAALGFVAGAGVWFNYGGALTAAYAAGAILLFARPALTRRTVGAALAGAAVGLAPLAWMASRVGSAVFDIHGRSLVAGEGPPLGEQLGRFFRSVYVDAEPIAAGVAVLVPLAGLVGLAGAWRGPEDRGRGGAGRRAGFLAGYLALFFVAYLSSGFVVGTVYHYFLFHRLSQPWVLGLLLAAAGLPRLAAAGGALPRALGWLFLLALPTAGVLGLVRIVQDARPGDWASNFAVVARTKGYAYPEYFGKVLGHLEGDRVERMRTLAGFEEDAPALVAAALAENVYADGSVGIDEALAEARAAGVSGDGLLRGMGQGLRARYGGDLVSRLAEIEGGDEALRERLTWALGRFGLGLLVTEDRARREVMTGIEGRFPDAYFRGLGYRLWHVRGDRALGGWDRQTNSPFAVDAVRAKRFISRQPARVALLLREGYEAARAEHTLAR